MIQIACRPVTWALLVSSVSATAAHAIDCSSTQFLGASQTFSQDYASTGSGDCISISAANVNINCNGKSIICNNPSGCGTAITSSQSGTTIRNCRILNGTGKWAFGVSARNGSSSTDASIFGNYIRNPIHVGVMLGQDVHQNVVIGAGDQCYSAVFWAYNAGTVIEKNYCSSDSVGIVATGPSSGTPLEVDQNYVRGAIVGMAQAGLVDFDRNIIDSPDDFSLSNPSDVTFSFNFCDDAECEEPLHAGTGTPFELTLTVN